MAGGCEIHDDATVPALRFGMLIPGNRFKSRVTYLVFCQLLPIVFEQMLTLLAMSSSRWLGIGCMLVDDVRSSNSSTWLAMAQVWKRLERDLSFTKDSGAGELHRIFYKISAITATCCDTGSGVDTLRSLIGVNQVVRAKPRKLSLAAILCASAPRTPQFRGFRSPSPLAHGITLSSGQKVFRGTRMTRVCRTTPYHRILHWRTARCRTLEHVEPTSPPNRSRYLILFSISAAIG